MKSGVPQSKFIKVNGINLHYLDWGGQGTVLLFLTGLGNSVYIYGSIAPRFADRFHVIALTRRGHGDSDCPETGYDIETLTDDIDQFMTALEIDKAVIAGHSMSNLEMCHLSVLHPEKVIKFVFFDANYDRASESFQAMIRLNPLRSIQIPGQDDEHKDMEDYFASLKKSYPEFDSIWGDVLEEDVEHCMTKNQEGTIVDKMSSTASQALYTTLRSCSPEDAALTMPVLSFFAIKPPDYFLSKDYMDADQRSSVIDYFTNILPPLQKVEIEKFHQAVPHAQIVEVPKGHHYCFIKNEELVYEEMCNFLEE